MAEASTIECPWRTANAGGRPVEITALRCQATRADPEFLVRCYKHGCKGADEPRAKAAEAARPAISKHEEPAEEAKGSPVVGPGLCACGRPAKARGKYASKNCRDRHRYHQKHPGAKPRPRHVAKPAEPAPAPAAPRLESEGPKALKALGTLKEDAQRHHSVDLDKMVPAPKPVPVAGPVAVLLAERPALLKQLTVMAIEEERTLEAQTIWCLREYLHIHAEAVRLAARRFAEASAATEAHA